MDVELVELNEDGQVCKKVECEQHGICVYGKQNFNIDSYGINRPYVPAHMSNMFENKSYRICVK